MMGLARFHCEETAGAKVTRCGFEDSQEVCGTVILGNEGQRWIVLAHLGFCDLPFLLCKIWRVGDDQIEGLFVFGKIVEPITMLEVDLLGEIVGHGVFSS